MGKSHWVLKEEHVHKNLKSHGVMEELVAQKVERKQGKRIDTLDE